ncbi:hypothetical protein ACFLSG_00565 [Candidatus Bipolaricaulota bacterium]
MNCIGVDVSKQELVTYDGKKERLFPNTQGLDAFARFLKKSRVAYQNLIPGTQYLSQSHPHLPSFEEAAPNSECRGPAHL